MPLPYNDTHNDTCDAVEPGHYVGKKLNETSKGLRYIYSMLSAQHAHKPTHILIHTHSNTYIGDSAANDGTTKENRIKCVCSTQYLFAFYIIFFSFLFFCAFHFATERFDMNESIMCFLSPCEFHYNSIFSPAHHVFGTSLCVLCRKV